MDSSSSHRGQIFSQDLLLAISIAAFLLLSVAFASLKVAEKAATLETERAGSVAAFYAISSLLETPGTPANWTPSNYNGLGIASSRNVLDPAKLVLLLGMPDDEVGSALGLNTESATFNFSLTIANVNGSVVASKGAGPPPGSFSSSLSRPALLSGVPVLVTMEVWRE